MKKLDFSSIDKMQAREIFSIAKIAVAEKERFNKIQDFVPNPSQLEFFKNTKIYDEILLSWANRTGKTWAVGAIIYYHLTGNYPDWWPGRKFDRPVRVMIMGLTRNALRESAQRILLDEYQTGEYGSGVIPKHVYEKCEFKWSKDDNYCVDFIRVPYKSGGKSYVLFTTQQVDWKSIQGTEFDICWADEQLEGVIQEKGAPPRHYSQFLRATATNLDDRLIILSATPENGRLPIFDYFEQTNKRKRLIHYATLYDAHYSVEKADSIRDSYPEYEWDYRVYGRPRIGTGLVYRFTRELLFCKPFEIPKHWRRLGAFDFGRKASKTAVVWITKDPASGIYYFYDTDWKRESDPIDIVPMVKKRDQDAGFCIPYAWPKDGAQCERSTGNQVAKIYADLGVRMLGECAYMVGQDGKKSDSVEAGVSLIQGLMDAGLLRIFDTPENQVFNEELSFYCRDENNKIKKSLTRDPHHLDAARYGMVMFERFAYSSGKSYHGQIVPMTIKIQKGIFHGN